jgi:hypothetical protein
MRGSLFDDIPVLSPKQAEKERQVQSQGFQHYRDSVLRALSNLTFSEKFRIIKKVDRDILARVNTYQGTKAVHTLNYLHKIPSRKENLTKIDEIVLILRSLYVICARNDYYKERRRKIIRVVKYIKY